MERDWLKIISNLAVIVGLGIVIYELDQTQTHVRSQLLMDDFVSRQTLENTIMGDDAAAAIAKARSEPEQLTDEEKIIVEAHLTSVFIRLESYEYIENVGVYDETWELAIPIEVKDIFDYPYARSWWARYRQREMYWNRRLTQLMDESLGYELR